MRPLTPLMLLLAAGSTLSFTLRPHVPTKRLKFGMDRTMAEQQEKSWRSSWRAMSLSTRLLSSVNCDDGDLLGKQFDEYLEQGNLEAAGKLLHANPQNSIVTLENRDRWNAVFNAIEQQTAEAEESVEQVNTRRIAEFPLTSKARDDMNLMYQTLRNDCKQLTLFGAINPQIPPAAGSHAVRPALLEEITNLPITAFTPSKKNNLIYAGAAFAVLEGIASVALNVNLNVLVLATLGSFFVDRIFLNGAILESFYKVLNPGIQSKIQRHEAGHFLIAYLLGCPVEGCVLNAWAALQDSRFGMGRQVTAGTSFYDPVLSQQINSPQRQVTRSSIDKYSVIAMGGIAAEAVYYQQAEGGAGDEMALISFLSQLNGSAMAQAASQSALPWNNVTIRNQARWGALQAVLILREYKPCYDALVEALEKHGSLGDCIYAIEKAARDNNLGPLQEPIGYIIEHPGNVEEWTSKPLKSNVTVASATNTKPQPALSSPEDSMAWLGEYKKEMEDKLKAIDDKLDGLKKVQ